MSQIQTKVLKQGTSSTKVLSCSFFTMQDSYKNFEKYQCYLKKMLKDSAFLTDFEVRIYTDDTGSDFALQAAKKYPNVSVIHFNCPELREGSGHIGMFGALARFLPMFEKGLECVWITDIDVPADWFQLPLNKNVDAFLSTIVCYNRKPYSKKYTLLAGHNIYWFTFPQQLLTNFINKVLDGGYSSMIETLNNLNSRKPASKFPYGFDEVFINDQIYNYLVRHDKKFILKKIFHAEGFISYLPEMTAEDKQYLKENYNNHSAATLKNAVKVYKKYIPFVLEKYPCLQELLDNVSKFKDKLETYQVLHGHNL